MPTLAHVGSTPPPRDLTPFIACQYRDLFCYKQYNHASIKINCLLYIFRCHWQRTMATKFLQVLLSKRAPIINQMCTRITPWKHLHRNIMHTKTRCVQIGGYHTSAMVQSDRDKPLDEIISSRDPRWMRENCRCDSCYNHSTAQRNVIFYELKPEQLDITDIQRDDTMQSISIRWADGHQSVYNEEWLINNSYPGNRGRIIRKFWDGATMKSNEIDQVPREVFIDDSNEGVQ